jgi:hypothetical protein
MADFGQRRAPGVAQRPAPVAARAAHPHGLRRRRIPAARTAVDAAQLHPAANDGRGALFLRSGGREVYRRPLPGRSGQALRRHRQRADLAGLSEYRHRQPQPVGPGSRLAGRHPRLAADGRRFPSPRRAGLLSQHALGHRHARPRPAVLGRDRAANGRDRRRRRERRYLRRDAARLPHGLRRRPAIP